MGMHTAECTTTLKFAIFEADITASLPRPGAGEGPSKGRLKASN